MISNNAKAQDIKPNWAFNAYLGANYDFYRFNITQSNGARLSSNGLQFGVSRQKKKFYQEFVLTRLNKSSSADLNPSYDSLGREIYTRDNYDDIRQFSYGFTYQAGWQLIGNETSKFKLIGGLDLGYNYSKLKINEVYEREYVSYTRWSVHALKLGVFSKGSYSITHACSVNLTLLYEPFYGGLGKSNHRSAKSNDKTTSYSWFSGAVTRYYISGRLGVSYQF